MWGRTKRIKNVLGCNGGRRCAAPGGKSASHPGPGGNRTHVERLRRSRGQSNGLGRSGGGGTAVTRPIGDERVMFPLKGEAAGQGCVTSGAGRPEDGARGQPTRPPSVEQSAAERHSTQVLGAERVFESLCTFSPPLPLLTLFASLPSPSPSRPEINFAESLPNMSCRASFYFLFFLGGRRSKRNWQQQQHRSSSPFLISLSFFSFFWSLSVLDAFCFLQSEKKKTRTIAAVRREGSLHW